MFDQEFEWIGPEEKHIRTSIVEVMQLYRAFTRHTADIPTEYSVPYSSANHFCWIVQTDALTQASFDIDSKGNIDFGKSCQMFHQSIFVP